MQVLCHVIGQVKLKLHAISSRRFWIAEQLRSTDSQTDHTSVRLHSIQEAQSSWPLGEMHDLVSSSTFDSHLCILKAPLKVITARTSDHIIADRRSSKDE